MTKSLWIEFLDVECDTTILADHQGSQGHLIYITLSGHARIKNIPWVARKVIVTLRPVSGGHC